MSRGVAPEKPVLFLEQFTFFRSWEPIVDRLNSVHRATEERNTL